MARSPVDPFVCPDCGTRSPAATDCPRCEVPLVDERLFSADALDHHVEVLTVSLDSWPLLVLVLAPMLAAGIEVRLPGTTRVWLGGLPMVATMFLGLVFLVRQSKQLPWIAFRRFERAARARLEAVTPTTLAGSLAEGVAVRVTGTASGLTHARDPDGRPCLAHQRLSAEKVLAPKVRSGGCVFELVDDAGRRVRVDARHAVIVDVDREPVTIMPGAKIEVLGVAHHAVTEDLPADGPRGVSRVVELRGTDDAPIVIRVLAPTTDARVRIDAGAEAAPEAHEVQVDTADARGRRAR